MPTTQFEALPGLGAQALVSGKSIAVGGPRLLSERRVPPPPEVVASAAEGKTALFVASRNGVFGAFAVEDEIRPESKQAVDELHRMGMRTTAPLIHNLQPRICGS